MPPQYIFQIENLSKSIAKKRDPQEHLALVLPGGQDRRARRQRRGQEHAPADHGGRRQGLRRHRQARARDDDRLRPAGADARPDARRPGQRRAGRRQDPGPARPGSTRSTPGSASRSTPDEMEKLLDEQAKVQDAIEAANAWDLDRNVEIAMDAMRLPPGDADVVDPLRRREAPGRALQGPARTARHPPARRADEPPRRRVASPGSSGTSQEYPGHGRRRHPRPLLPRQRRRLDPRARPRPGHPLAGELHLLARAEAGAAGQGGEAGEQPPQDPGPRAGVGPDGPPRPGRQEPGPARRATSSSPAQDAEKRDEAIVLQIPPGPHLGDLVVAGRGRQEGVRRPPPGRGHDLPPPARRDRRHHRPQRRGQDDALPDDRRPGDARRRRRSASATPWSPPTSTRAATTLNPENTIFQEITGGARPGRPGQAQGAGAGLRRLVQLQGARPGEEGRPTSPAASGTASTWPSSSRAAATSCCSTSRPTTSTSTCSAPSKRRSSTSAAAPW